MGAIKARHLIEKGWKKSDINKTLKIIEKAKESKHPKIKLLDKAVYWLSLLLAIIGNFVISLALIPELLVLEGLQLYLITATLGISFGMLFELLVRTIENLKARHHLLLSIIIPLLAVINFVIVSINMKRLVGIDNPQNPVIVGIVYALSFILPYSAYQLFVKNKI